MNNKRVTIEVDYPEDTTVNVFAKPKKHLKDSYARYFLNEMLALAVDRNFSGTDFRVILAIIGNLGYDNILNISQQELGDQLYIKRQNIAKTIKKLVDKGYLKIIDKVGRQNIYQFNPHVAFRSRAKNLKELKQAWDKANIPNTQNKPIDVDLDIQPDLEDKLEDKVTQLSRQFDISQSKARQIILSLVDQALGTEEQEELELPY